MLGAQPILEDQGLYFAGEIESASRVVSDGPGSSFNFRFFVQVPTLEVAKLRCDKLIRFPSGGQGFDTDSAFVLLSLPLSVVHSLGPGRAGKGGRARTVASGDSKQDGSSEGSRSEGSGCGKADVV